MIEIFVLITLSKSIAAKAREKGHNGCGFIIMLLVLWFGGEICGGIAAAIVSMVLSGDDEPNMLLAYLGALVGAIIGAVIAFQIMKALKPAQQNDTDDYEDPDREDRPWRRDRDDDRW